MKLTDMKKEMMERLEEVLSIAQWTSLDLSSEFGDLEKTKTKKQNKNKTKKQK